ncbi:MAG: hypothetical protein K9G42_00910 [Pedobacter sp.]|nr:hypothetical protein [Pedobacter sp.]
MPALTEHHAKILGPLISPFERSSMKALKTHLRAGEGHNKEFMYAIHDGIDNHKPTTPYVELSIEERDEHGVLNGIKYFPKCYLWVIDKISLKIMYENTPNILRGEEIPDKPFVCHTNITGCEKAYIGGEMYFCEDGCIYINFISDRYGWPETDEKKLMAIEVMEFHGYKNVKMLKGY